MLNLNQGPHYDLQGLNRQLQDLLAQYSNLSQQQTAQAFAPPAAPAPTQISYVKGIDGARAVKLAPSSSVILMDSQDDVFYVKATDANGVETLFSKGTFTLEDVGADATDAVTRKDLDELKQELKALVAEIKGGAE